MNTCDWGNLYLNRYDLLLGKDSLHQSIRFDDLSRNLTIQVLEYVNSPYHTFCSLGLSKWFSDGDFNWEMYIDVKSEEADNLIRKELCMMINDLCIQAIENNYITFNDAVYKLSIQYQFTNIVKKNCVYIRRSIHFKEEHSTIKCGKKTAIIFMAMLISEKEYDHVREKGTKALEDAFYEKDVDISDIRRESCI